MITTTIDTTKQHPGSKSEFVHSAITTITTITTLSILVFAHQAKIVIIYATTANIKILLLCLKLLGLYLNLLLIATIIKTMILLLFQFLLSMIFLNYGLINNHKTRTQYF